MLLDTIHSAFSGRGPNLLKAFPSGKSGEDSWGEGGRERNSHGKGFKRNTSCPSGRGLALPLWNSLLFLQQNNVPGLGYSELSKQNKPGQGGGDVSLTQTAGY